ncbi:MAG: aldo/keto reductase [Bdellovibrionales bacterium]|nr:aldo/keto reductase [Bdellovibrionales bacterium]
MKRSDLRTESRKSLTPVWFGGWQASGWVTSRESRFTETLEHYLSLGGNAIDTAEGYGNGLSEKLIGQVLNSKEREDVFVATKFHHYRTSLSQIEKALDRSLKNLRTDYVDLLYQHWPAKERVSERVIESIISLREKGKVRNIGVSNWDQNVFQELFDPTLIDVIQNCYNLLWRKDESWFPNFQENGRPRYLAYSPLAQGLLAGRRELFQKVPSDHRSKNVLFDQSSAKDTLALLEKLDFISKEFRVPTATLSLAWVLSRPFVSGAIAGASSLGQVDENFAATSFLNSEATGLADKLFSRPIDLERPLKSMWEWHPRAE